MNNTPNVKLVSGNIFKLSKEFDGMALFMPCGMTAIRPNARKFLDSKPPLEIYYEDNPRHKIYEGAEVFPMVSNALNYLVGKGCKKIGMNAIRTREGAGLSEELVWGSVIFWLKKNEYDPEILISLIDLRGGFRKRDDFIIRRLIGGFFP